MSRFRIGLVINPTAGLGKGASVGVKVRDLFAEHDIDVADLSAHNAKDALARARAACISGLDGLVVVGGDGMVNLGVNATIGTETPLGIVAAGSGNDFATAIELPVRHLTRSVDVIIAALENGHVKAFDAAQVEPHVLVSQHARFGRVDAQATAAHSDTSRRWFAGSLSVGIDAAVNAQANTYKWPKGHLKYLRAVVACLVSFKPFGYKITVDGKTFESRGTLASISNSPLFGGGLPIAPMADMHDGMLDLVFATSLTKPEIMAIFPKLYKGGHVGHEAVSFQKGKKFLIEPSSFGPLPPVAFADGEVVGTVPLEVTAHAGVLRILVPQDH